MGKGELATLDCWSFSCFENVIVLWLFILVLLVGLQYVIVIFSSSYSNSGHFGLIFIKKS